MKAEVGDEWATTYNFHDLFRVAVAHRGVADLMAQEFELFRTAPDAVDLTVEEGAVEAGRGLLFEEYSYDDGRFIVDLPGGRAEVADNRLRADPGCQPYRLYALWVEGLMKRRIVDRGAAFVHASAVAQDGVGLLLPAWMHSGKTDLALNFLTHGYDYMADDWCFVTGSGEILGYPRRMTLFGYHFEEQPGLLNALSKEERRDLRRRLGVTRIAGSIRGSNLVSRKLREYLMGRFYVYKSLPATLLVPRTTVRTRAPLTKACLLVTERGATGEAFPLSADELARLVVLCGDYERRPFDAHRIALAYAGHRWALDDVRSREVELLTRAFANAQCFRVSVPPEAEPRDLNRVRQAIEGA